MCFPLHHYSSDHLLQVAKFYCLNSKLHWSNYIIFCLSLISCSRSLFERTPVCFYFVIPSVDIVEESHGPATPEMISGFEEFIPIRLTCLTLLQASITVSMAEFNLLHTLMPVIMGSKVLHTDRCCLYLL